MLTVTIPGLRLVSEANAHEHWRKRSARVKHQHSVVSLVLRLQSCVFPAHPVPLVVTITRIGTRLMDSDNAVGAAKHVRDAVAKWLGRDDSEEGCVEWRVMQRRSGKSKTYWVEIRIETEEETWPKRGGHLTEIERAQLRNIGQSSKARGSRRKEVA